MSAEKNGVVQLQKIDIQDTINVIKDLVHIPSPSGYTKDAMAYLESYLQKVGIKTNVTNKGTLLATIKGKDDSRQRMLTAHVDTLGAIVKEVKKNGRLKIDLIGGFSYHSIEGDYVQIHKMDGRTVSGTVVMHQSSIHVYKDARTAERNQENMEIRIDEPVQSDLETEKLGIQVGDFVSFSPKFEQTLSGFIKSRHLDDKASVALLLSLLKQLKEDAIQPEHTVHVLFSNNEEIGYGGNANIPEGVVEYVAVDMGAIGDGQQTDEYTASICVKDGSGPYHYGLRKQFVSICEEKNIPYKLDIYPFYASDASAAIKAGHDIVHGLIGPGIEGSHSMERTHVSSLEATYKLLQEYVQAPINH
ncbi:deblocking aminopeptidase [Bacillus sp. JCM 19046]|nr:deblocking aminopeptidase [Bacillus sp. JCM 19045]GAF19147.1 deblocking aminopeptidase [Bacillus sp. JCM 19046]